MVVIGASAGVEHLPPCDTERLEIAQSRAVPIRPMPPLFGKCPAHVRLGASGMLVISGTDQLQFKLLLLLLLLAPMFVLPAFAVTALALPPCCARDGSLYSNEPVPDLQLNVDRLDRVPWASPPSSMPPILPASPFPPLGTVHLDAHSCGKLFEPC